MFLIFSQQISNLTYCELIRFCSLYFVGKVCTASQETLHHYIPQMCHSYTPLSTLEDVKCLFRVVSLGLHGSEKYHIRLSLRTVLELSTNQQFYLQQQ